MTRQGPYTVERRTSAYGIPKDIIYWIKPEFKSTLSKSSRTRSSVEGNVFRHHISNLQNRCYNERMEKQRLEFSARQVLNIYLIVLISYNFLERGASAESFYSPSQ